MIVQAVSPADVAGVLEVAGGAAGGLTAVAALLWWLVGPKVREFVRSVRDVQDGQREAIAQLTDTTPGTVAGNAAAAAGVAAEVAQLHVTVTELVKRMSQLDALELDRRLALVEAIADNLSSRLGVVEQAVIVELQGQLRESRAEHLATYSRPDQVRADQARARRQETPP